MGKHYRAAREITKYLDATRRIGSTSLVVEAVIEAAKTNKVIFVVHSYEFGRQLAKQYGLGGIDNIQIATISGFVLGYFYGTRKVVFFDHYALYQLLIGLMDEIDQANEEAQGASKILDVIEETTYAYKIRGFVPPSKPNDKGGDC